MCNLYKRLVELCEKKGITGYRMCKDCGISVGAMTDLKMGRRTCLSAVNTNKLADYFGVSVGYLLGEEVEAKKESPSSEEDRLRLLIDSLSAEHQKQVEDYVRFLASQEGIQAP